MNANRINKLQLAARWVRAQMRRRISGYTKHPSFLAAEVMMEADRRYALGSHGVEGWSISMTAGTQYLNFGDPYITTILVTTSSSAWFVAVGCWGDIVPEVTL